MRPHVIVLAEPLIDQRSGFEQRFDKTPHLSESVNLLLPPRPARGYV